MQSKKTALITGASSGIGYELARVFARNGYDLVLVARSEQQLVQLADELKATYGSEVVVMKKDLSLSTAPGEIVAELEQRVIAIDALVNNAGVGAFGMFTELDLDTQLRMMQVNMVTLTHLTRLLLPPMLERRSGKILNVASTAAFQPGPLMTVYYATKAYVLSFSEGLVNELQGSGVSVTALCPGPTASGFQKRAVMEDSRLVQGGLMSAQAVAEIGYRALMKNQAIVIPGLRNRVMALSVRVTPRAIVRRFVRRIQERLH